MRAFPVGLPSSVRYWTVVDDEYRVVGAADGYLQHLRFGHHPVLIIDHGPIPHR